MDQAQTMEIHAHHSIGWAVEQLNAGDTVTRRGWNGRHYLKLQTPDTLSKMNRPYVYICTEQGDVIPWLCSQADLLATDWVIHG